jgi:hypothetical protein
VGTGESTAQNDAYRFKAIDNQDESLLITYHAVIIELCSYNAVKANQ